MFELFVNILVTSVFLIFTGVMSPICSGRLHLV